MQPGRFLSLHLSHLVRHPTLKGYSTKKDLLETHLATDVPPDAIMEPIIRIRVARIGGQVQLVHLGEGQTIVLADLAHRYMFGMFPCDLDWKYHALAYWLLLTAMRVSNFLIRVGRAT